MSCRPVRGPGMRGSQVFGPPHCGARLAAATAACPGAPAARRGVLSRRAGTSGRAGAAHTLVAGDDIGADVPAASATAWLRCWASPASTCPGLAAMPAASLRRTCRACLSSCHGRHACWVGNCASPPSQPTHMPNSACWEAHTLRCSACLLAISSADRSCPEIKRLSAGLAG
jgi:hypothetical protein